MARLKRWWTMLFNEHGFAGPKKDEEDPDIDAGDEEDEEEKEKEKKEKKGLVVDLDEEDEVEEGEEAEIDLDEVDDEEKIKQTPEDKRKFYESRKIKKLKTENERLKKERDQRPAYTPPAPAQPAVSAQPTATDPNEPRNWTDDQWDAYAKQDWKGAVDLRSKINAENTYQTQQQVSKEATALEASKKVAMERHPELLNDTSEKSKIFIQILEENPRYKTDPKGPIHAMRDMEERMKELGYKPEEIVAAEKSGVKREQDRQSRVALSSTQGRHASTGAGRKIQLTAQDLEFCKFHNIDPKEFAKSKHKLQKSEKGGLQV